jgi:hypothetical protein
MNCTRIAAALTLALASASSQAAPVTLVDGTTQGRYNSAIGTLLNGTSAAFPTAGDPVLDFAVAPDLLAAAAVLGDWLTTPAAPGGSWTGLQAIPAGWTVGTETAIIYAIDAGDGLDNVIASFGVDNGIFVWLDGVFLGGHMRPGGSVLGEFTRNLGALSAGTHYLQVLREDHGGATGYAVSVTGERRQMPEPGTLGLLGVALAGAAWSRRRRG